MQIILNINKYPRKFKLYILPLHFWFPVGNILQSPVVAPGAGEILHPRIDCHMADRQQDRSGTGSAGLRAGARRGKLIETQFMTPLDSYLLCFHVITQEGHSLASGRGLYFIETSALSGDQVNKLLEDVGRCLAHQKLWSF